MSAVRAEASAPGKLIVMGEHAAVYDRPALVAALGLRTRASVSPTTAGELELDLPDLGYRERLGWEEVFQYGDRRRRLWRRYCEEPTAKGFADLGGPDEAGFARIAVAEAMGGLERSENSRLRPSLSLSVRSELPVGSGLGSSASVAVAIGAALVASLSEGGEPVADDQRIARAAWEAEKRQHGRPSGVDHTTVIRGGFLAFSREDGSLRAFDLPRPDWFRQAIRVYDTGAPAETTGEVVAAVRNLRDRKPRRFGEILEQMETSTREVMAALEQDDPCWSTLLRSVRRFERCLEELEVVPESVADAVRQVEAAGGAAKISGAGSLSGPSGGSLIVIWPPEARGVADLATIVGAYRPLEALLGVAGLELTRHSVV